MVLALLAVVLTLIVIFILARMCCARSAVTKAETVLKKLDTMPPPDQYDPAADGKDLLAGKRSKKPPSKQHDQDASGAADVLYQEDSVRVDEHTRAGTA